MPIGKPLLVTERQGVQDIVKSGQINPLSTQVAAQKLSFVDYNIGQDNSKAAFAVTDELINMGGALGKSAIYIAQTKNAHKKVQIAEEFRGLQDSFNKSMAETNDLVGRENLYAGYMENMKSLSDSSSSSLMQDAESQQFMASMRAQSKNIGNTAFTKIESQRFSETKGAIKASLGVIEADITSNPNADLRANVGKANDLYDELHRIGALSDRQWGAAKFTNAQSLIVLKGTRMGITEAQNYNGLDYDDADEAFGRFNEYLKNNQIRVTAATERSFKEAYSTSLSKTWSDEASRDANMERFSEFKNRESVNERIEKFARALSRGEISDVEATEHVNGLEALGLWGKAAKLRQDFDSADKPITSVVDRFTDIDSEFYSDLRKVAFNKDGSFLSTSVEQSLKDAGIEHGPTVIEIVGKLAEGGRATAKDYIDGSGVTDGIRGFLLTKVDTKNISGFMTEIGVSLENQNSINETGLTLAKDRSGLLSALKNAAPEFDSIITRMKAIIGADARGSAKGTPFQAHYRKDGTEYDRWQDRTGEKAFRTDYQKYMGDVFRIAKKETIEIMGSKPEEISGEIKKKKVGQVLRLVDKYKKGKKTKLGDPTFAEELARIIGDQ